MPDCPHCGAYSIRDLGVRCPACGKEIKMTEQTKSDSQETRNNEAKPKSATTNPVIYALLALALIIVIGFGCCGGFSGGGGSNRSAPKQQEPRIGWLCDFDGTGSIRLWTSASMQATVKDIVGTCVGCCVDVTMLDETSVEGILFYKISVGSQSGWVDVEYFYWSKPGWSTN